MYKESNHSYMHIIKIKHLAANSTKNMDTCILLNTMLHIYTLKVLQMRYKDINFSIRKQSYSYLYGCMLS